MSGGPILALDVGTSSVKAALLDGTDLVGPVAVEPFDSRREANRAEVDVEQIEAAIFRAAGRIDAGSATAIGLTGMAPAWLAMGENGDALTPVVTHQDRRSTREAIRIERTVGHGRHLALAGNRPTPGGISSTTAAWFATHADVLDHAACLGHLPTYLVKRLTGRFVIDPSNAGFTGLMDVSTGRWSDLLCRAARVKASMLPEIVDAREPAGLSAGNDLNLPPDVPVFGGVVDGSGPLLLAGAEPGTLVHSAGSTDVLALCLAKPMPREGLLCRPVGTSGLWVSAATQAAGAAGLAWVRSLCFADLDDDAFAGTVREAQQREPAVTFEPFLAGDRQRVQQPTASLAKLTLGHDRLDVLAAVLRALVADHVTRLRRLLKLADDAKLAVRPRVVTTGGGELLGHACRAAWPGRPDGRSWAFDDVDQATLRGLATLRQE